MSDKTISHFQTGSPLGRNDDPPFKPGAPAKNELGVAYFGPYERLDDGFNEHTRRCARALALTGCPVQLRGLKGAMVIGELKAPQESIAHLINESISQYSVQIHQVILRGTTAQNIVSHRFMSPKELEFVNKRRVIYSVFERDRIDPDIVRALNQVGQVWTACKMNAEMLIRCEVKNVRVVPIPFFLDDPLLKLRGRERKPGVPRFYHIGKWEPRKAQENILLSFMRAFKPGQAYLVIKTSFFRTPVIGYPQSPQEAVATFLSDDKIVKSNGWVSGNWKEHIEIIAARLHHNDLVALHRFGDIYVSLSRGEGFDMPAFDAKLAGNMLVYTPSGGPQDFADIYDVRIDGKADVKCHPFYGWEKDAMYMDHKVEASTDALEIAVERFHRFGPRSGLSLNDRVHAFGAKAIGSKMLKNLQEITDKVF